MMLKNLKEKLFSPIPIYSLVFTRIVFGCLMMYQAIKYLTSNPDTLYWHYVSPRLLFKYYGFGWIEPWPGNGIYYHFYVLGILAFFITIGAFYRISMILFTIGFTYFFLLDKIAYLNHFYMVILFCILLCFMPANRYFSVDAWLKPKIKTTVINFWPVFLLRLQMEIILLYAGFVKINPDWLQGIPLKYWLVEGSRLEFLNYFFKQDWAPMVGSYGTILLHLGGAPLLLWKRSRIYIFTIYCLFHISNSFTFKIGIFPWMTIALTLIFFNPDWPVKLFRIKENIRDRIFVPLSENRKKLIMWLIAIWATIQILVPLRCFLYPGYTLWHQQGHEFSWRMKLHEVSGETSFLVTDKNDGKTWHIRYGEVNTMHCHPDLILQFAHHLRDNFKKEGKDVIINAYSMCSLDRRLPRLYIDPTVDLAAEERSFRNKKWILPFDPKWN